jgi:hypothetical protein
VERHFKLSPARQKGHRGLNPNGRRELNCLDCNERTEKSEDTLAESVELEEGVGIHRVFSRRRVLSR